VNPHCEDDRNILKEQVSKLVCFIHIMQNYLIGGVQTAKMI